MDGRRGLGEVWLVLLIILVLVIGALAVAGGVSRDGSEQAAQERPAPTQDVFEPPGANEHDGKGMPGTPHAASAGTAAFVAHEHPRIAGVYRQGALWVKGIRAYRPESVA
jgi:hypothetical protein